MSRRPQRDGPRPVSDISATAPLGLHRRLTPPSMDFDFVPVVDLCVIALLFSLLFTRFVVTPGVRVELPATELQMQHTPKAVAVLTIGNQGMLFFDGGAYDSGNIARAFDKYLLRTAGRNPVLLVKAEGEFSLQAFLDLCRMARDAGFDQVQIAGRKPEEEIEVFPMEPAANPVLLP